MKVRRIPHFVTAHRRRVSVKRGADQPYKLDSKVIDYDEAALCEEYDAFLLDRLAEKILGIKDISSKKDEIKKMIK